MKGFSTRGKYLGGIMANTKWSAMRYTYKGMSLIIPQRAIKKDGTFKKATIEKIAAWKFAIDNSLAIGI